MDANQRSEVNNQTNNGANEKWTPGSQGKTADNGQPLDLSHPQGSGTQPHEVRKGFSRLRRMKKVRVANKDILDVLASHKRKVLPKIARLPGSVFFTVNVCRRL